MNPRLRWARRMVMGTLCLLIVTMPVAIHAEEEFSLPDPGLLPGSWLYFAKSWGESIRTFLTFGDEKKVERQLYLSERRLAEFRALAEKGKTALADKALVRYEEHMTAASARVERLKERGSDSIEAIVERLSAATLNHQSVLTEGFDASTTDAITEGVQRAVETTQHIYDQALQGITEERIDAIKDRLREVEAQVRPKILEFLQTGAEQLRDSGLLVPCSDTERC